MTKAEQPSEPDPSRPKYPVPLAQITDLAGVRVIAFFPATLTLIDEVVGEEFEVVERSDKGAELIEEEKFGYRSIHFLVKIAPHRARLPEYGSFANAVTEVQVRTILQHAWAEIEHGIQYKSASVIPTEIRRRFMSLAGMLEIADREFQAIQDTDKRLMEQARSRVEQGQLENVEITPDALKAYLDKRLGPDGRMRDWSYSWTTKLLKGLGFRTLKQLEESIDGYNDNQLSRIATGGRQRQLSRFEFLLLTGMGEKFIERHTWSANSAYFRRILGEYAAHNIPARNYDPLNELSTHAAEDTRVSDTVAAALATNGDS